MVVVVVGAVVVVVVVGVSVVVEVVVDCCVGGMVEVSGATVVVVVVVVEGFFFVFCFVPCGRFVVVWPPLGFLTRCGGEGLRWMCGGFLAKFSSKIVSVAAAVGV